MDIWVVRAPLPLCVGALNFNNTSFHLHLQQRKRFNIITSSAATSMSTGVLDVNEIRKRYKKWQWKGQYSINYLVSSNPNSLSNSSLLLVHGFGASIPQWRRLLFIIIILYAINTIHTFRYPDTTYLSIYLSTKLGLFYQEHCRTGKEPHCLCHWPSWVWCFR